MKKLLSLLLVLGLVLGLAGCQAAGDYWQTQPSIEQTDGTTEPLFWPPLPAETQDTTAPTEDSQPEDQSPTTPSKPTDPKPAIKPTTPSDNTDATYIPREDDDLTEPREDVSDWPAQSEPTESEPTESESDIQPDSRPDPRPETQPEAEQETEPQPEPSVTKPTQPKPTQPKPDGSKLDPNGTYDSKEDVALFIVTYGRLPNNFYTKAQAKRQFGWTGGSLSTYQYGACIGGDKFRNDEGQLPWGHTYYECDIDTIDASKRGAKRLVFTYDGLVYYTYNHYETFILLYGDP